MIDYTKKIRSDREVYPIEDINYSSESDRGRIISSPAFRRLQKRTQVFPLEMNAAVRSRLTHSLEVQQTSRYIAKTILASIKENGETEKFGLSGLEDAFISICEMSALLHDIGNPPFGHFAEASMNRWIAKEIPTVFEKFEEDAFKSMLIKDLSNFDGNAQAIRMVEKLQRLNLSYTQSASVLKYTRAAGSSKPLKSEPLSYVKKKPGFYYSEEAFVKKMCSALGMEEGRRFPLTYIMEAADDISYLTADIEDAVDKGILTLERIYELIQIEIMAVYKDEVLEETYLMKLVEKAYTNARKNEKPYQFNMFLTLLRAWLINDLVKHVSHVYLENHQAIFDGEFNSALLEFESNSSYTKAVKALQILSIKHIYGNHEVETLELKGHAILTGLLNHYRPVLELDKEEVSALVEEKRVDDVIAQKLFRRLSKKHVVAYSKSVELIDETFCEEKKSVLELYYRVRLVLDYISGMTDDYALQEFQTLSAL